MDGFTILEYFMIGKLTIKMIMILLYMDKVQ